MTTPPINYDHIRTHNGSQTGGFEELICQLAHLEPPDNALTFVSKEGSGGDAGVECFWILSDQTEHGWQAKYFTKTPTDSQWGQIDKSVRTAIEKHPALKKYYVCLPVDRTDSRKNSKNGKQTKSALDKWNRHVEEWQELAHSKDMEIEFEYWGAHEIGIRLTQDDSMFRGRLLYWFDSTVLPPEKLRQFVEKQELTLGARYTPQFHVDLPIAQVLHGLISSEDFWSQLSNVAHRWLKELEVYLRITKVGDQTLFNESKLESLKLRTSLLDALQRRNETVLGSCSQDAQYVVHKVSRCLDDSYKDEAPDDKPHSSEKKFSDYVNKFFNETSSLEYWLERDPVKAAQSGALLVTGEAGSGKSHLFCDLAKQIVNESKTAILLLGQQYRGGNPLADLLDHLDLKTKSYADVLGAIDAAGESNKQKAVLMIDAINEGVHRNCWPDFLVGLVSEVANYPNIALAISCRSRFDSLLVPEQLGNHMTRIIHEGFRGFEHRAAARYLSEQGIAKPSVPITSPEFSNPLFVKTVSSALKSQGKTAWPKGNQGATNMFRIYVESLEAIVCRKRKISPNDRVVEKSLAAVAKELFPENMFGIGWDKATSVINAIDTAVNPNDSLMQMLLDEGALAEDIGWPRDSGGDNEPPIVVRFAYERFSDHFVANHLIAQLGEKDIEILFIEDGPIGSLMKDGRTDEIVGVLQALSILIAEKFEKELWDLIPEELKKDDWLFDVVFVDRLSQRAPGGFFDKTKILLNKIRSQRYFDRRLQILVELSNEPDHPWNGRFLHNHLSSRPMPERDEHWSTFVGLNDGSEGDSQTETIVRAHIEWAQSGNMQGIERERALLCAITLTWFFSTTNKATRDQASCALARLLSHFPDIVAELLELFANCNDLYVSERLLAAVYGAVSNIDDLPTIKTIANAVFGMVFKSGEPTAHLLYRDYARGVLELALRYGCLADEISPEQFRPPYRSAWPLDNPLDISGSGGSIESSLMGFINDFGKYTMSCVHHWSPTLLTIIEPQTWGDIFAEFRSRLTEEQLSLLDKYRSDWKNCHWSCDENDVEKITQDDVDNAKERFTKTLTPEQKEEFRWNSGNGREDSLASFSRKWAQRWIVQRCYELGWNAKLFDDFERTYSSSVDRRRRDVERIGKKYQRIALMEFMAHLSDNVHYKDEHDEETGEIRPYDGPWQPWKRDIDPTIWLRKTNDSGWDEWNEPVWWNPIAFKFSPCTDKEKKRWVSSGTDVPDFTQFVQIANREDHTNWYSLKGFAQWREKTSSGSESNLERDVWFRINSIIIDKSDLAKLKNEIDGQDYIDPHFVGSNSTGHQVFFREYPWHSSCRIPDEPPEWERKFACNYFLPFAEYEWESTDNDSSIEESIRIYLPSPRLIRDLKLVPYLNRFDLWLNDKNEATFQDPSVYSDGPRFGLIEEKAMSKYLIDRHKTLVWLIGGEKRIAQRDDVHSDSSCWAMMVFNSMLWLDENGELCETSHSNFHSRNF
ncbi:hypothetical protein [Rosistilla oblonga]|uniref:ATP-binding protein n=1 Tax=Rosistilla oblonga TaxID=2527990 RepID=A0A518IZ07_9BACT|nr:hypothetical protein [Rosistilla oblonga]QDV58322.1 hypothetical protein Mal33_43400 [Rosistilla oblonga]